MDGRGILSPEYTAMIITGILTGFSARVMTLVVDYRQIPTYPTGLFINLFVGFVAASLGSVAIPAIIEKDFVAVTFLALATQHFRDIRKIESESLGKLEQTEYTRRGEAYIDGIAKTYEARNYISLITSLATVSGMKLLSGLPLAAKIIVGAMIGFGCALIIKHLVKGKTVGDICNVRKGSIRIDGSELYVDDIFVTNQLGTERSRALFQTEGMAVVVEPKADIFHVTMDNFGQRQAMLFEACRALGVKRFRFTRKSYAKGTIVIALVPIIGNIDMMMYAIRNTPILENSRKVHRIMTAPVSGGHHDREH